MPHPILLLSDPPASAARHLPARSEVPAADTWNLSPLYPDEAAYLADLELLKSAYPALATFRGTLAQSPERLAEALEATKAVHLRLSHLSQYASLLLAADTLDPANRARSGSLDLLLAHVFETLSFLDPEIQAIPEPAFLEFLAHPALADWQIHLRNLRRFLPHTLPADQERLLALASNALDSSALAFRQLLEADLDFGHLPDPDSDSGATLPLTPGSLHSFLLHPSAPVRRAAFLQFYDEISAHRHTLATLLTGQIRTTIFLAKARAYPSSRHAALFADNLADSIYDSLVTAVRSRLPDLHRNLRLRRRVLGLDTLHFHDTYLPFVPSPPTRITFDQAQEIVLDSLATLGPDYVATLRQGFASRWCDRYENKGKRSGAFSSGTYRKPPYILMNYHEDVFSDLFTLAHEAGHSMHTWHAHQAQPFQDADYPIFLAEVASNVHEQLLLHHLLAQTTDPLRRAYLLARQADDCRASIFRQTMFAEFEKLTHALDEAGQPLTVETLRQTYRTLLDAYLAPACAIDDHLELECLRIPHFYSPFYVYKYATGLSAACALASAIQRHQPGAPERYIAFLRSGGSRDPLDTLRTAGVDMATPAPVLAALDLFAAATDELEQTLPKI